MDAAQDLNILAEMPSGPVAFVTGNRKRRLRTSIPVHSNSESNETPAHVATESTDSDTGAAHGLEVDKVACPKQEVKNRLSMLAFSIGEAAMACPSRRMEGNELELVVSDRNVL